MIATQLLQPRLIQIPTQKARDNLSDALRFQWFLSHRSTWVYRAQMFCKRLSDVVLASAGLIVLLPMLLVLALLVKCSSQGPVLYKSERLGQNQKRFGMYKFRTMVSDADQMRHHLRHKSNQQNELFKLEDDPRVTSIGRILRRYSLDEFPQLINVVKGDMSLVGPRPYAPDDSALFKAPYTARFLAPPGMTGLWQVSGRSNLKFNDVCHLEARYLSEWSLLKDASILAKTIPAVVSRHGAA
jgi:lipopolysaccharide/colanic/teichoic acid biosynthesis glycosyltransferase